MPFFAQQITDTFIQAYQNGLRDLRADALSGYYAETPRSVPSNDDVSERYAAITDAATEADNTVAAGMNEFLVLFANAEAKNNFIKYLTRQGLEVTLTNDLEQDTVDQLALRNAELIDLSIQQLSQGQVFNTTYIRSVLADSQLESLQATAVNHFVEDEQENDAIDADAKAGQRIRQMTQYIEDLLGKLS